MVSLLNSIHPARLGFDYYGYLVPIKVTIIEKKYSKKEWGPWKEVYDVEIEIYHVESDEERDDRVRTMENDVLMWQQRSKFNSENYRRELYETLKAEFENIKPKSALKSIN